MGQPDELIVESCEDYVIARFLKWWKQLCVSIQMPGRAAVIKDYPGQRFDLNLQLVEAYVTPIIQNFLNPENV